MTVGHDLEAGFCSLAAGRWHQAHDDFERAWVARSRRADAVQGLIQVAAARLHLERGRPAPAVALLGRALPKLDRTSGLDAGDRARIGRIRSECRSLLDRIRRRRSPGGPRSG